MIVFEFLLLTATLKSVTASVLFVEDGFLMKGATPYPEYASDAPFEWRKDAAPQSWFWRDVKHILPTGDDTVPFIAVWKFNIKWDTITRPSALAENAMFIGAVPNPDYSSIWFNQAGTKHVCILTDWSRYEAFAVGKTTFGSAILYTTGTEIDGFTLRRGQVKQLQNCTYEWEKYSEVIGSDWRHVTKMVFFGTYSTCAYVQVKNQLIWICLPQNSVGISVKLHDGKIIADQMFTEVSDWFADEKYLYAMYNNASKFPGGIVRGKLEDVPIMGNSWLTNAQLCQSGLDFSSFKSITPLKEKAQSTSHDHLKKDEENEV